MPPVGLQEAAGGTDLEGLDVGFIDEERGTEAMQAGPGRSQVHGAAAKAGLGEGARHSSHRGAGRHPPPTSGASGCDRRALHITAAGQHSGGKHTQQGAGRFMGFQRSGSLSKGKTKFPAFQAQQRK